MDLQKIRNSDIIKERELMPVFKNGRPVKSLLLILAHMLRLEEASNPIFKKEMD